jgi:plastocyanin
MERKVTISMLFGLLAPFALSCGSSSDGAAPGTASNMESPCDATIQLLDFKLSPADLETTNGPFELCVENAGKTPHDLAIRGPDGKDLARTPTLSEGEQSHLSLTLSTGTYPIYCAERGHESLGMHGMLMVR